MARPDSNHTGQGEATPTKQQATVSGEGLARFPPQRGNAVARPDSTHTGRHVVDAEALCIAGVVVRTVHECNVLTAGTVYAEGSKK